MRRFLGAATLAATAVAGAAHAADECGGYYAVSNGDTLSGIADRHYADAGNWTAIHTANLSSIGPNPNSIKVGQWLYLSCIKGAPVGLPVSIDGVSGGDTLAVAPTATNQDQAQPAAATARTTEVTRTTTNLLGTPELPRVKLVTGDDFAPFTDRSLMKGGLIAEVVSSAMAASVGSDGYDTFWINDRASHLDTMMPAGMMEMAYPWARPDCESNPEEARCASYHFSEPMFEYLVLLFVAQDRPIPFSTDEDIEGRVLCRPAGLMNHILDENGRNWLAEDKITLVQPESVAACFDALVEGDVEAVVLNEFTARDAIYSMGLQNRVEAVQSRPVSITGLHVLVHKSHPQSEELLATINGGLDTIKADGQYQEIVGRHMETIWSKF
ncbi:MAG: transporter substrate-binding domain-containing protein [Aliishimia sp.]